MIEKRADAIVRLHWHTEEEGGRQTHPTGEIYAANLRFEKGGTLWSIVLIFYDVKPDEMHNQVVGLGFLFRENLETKLEPGKQVFIYEGSEKLVAEGEIVIVN